MKKIILITVIFLTGCVNHKCNESIQDRLERERIANPHLHICISNDSFQCETKN